MKLSWRDKACCALHAWIEKKTDESMDFRQRIKAAISSLWAVCPIIQNLSRERQHTLTA